MLYNKVFNPTHVLSRMIPVFSQPMCLVYVRALASQTRIQKKRSRSLFDIDFEVLVTNVNGGPFKLYCWNVFFGHLRIHSRRLEKANLNNLITY
jgi:hypothetical protein